MKRLILIALMLMPAMLLAQEKLVWPDSHDPTAGRRVYLGGDWTQEDFFAVPDPESKGDILIYFNIDNDARANDSLFVIFNKEAFNEMREAIRSADATLKKWTAVARREGVERYRKEIPVQLPKVGFAFKRNAPRFGEYTYYPYFETVQDIQPSTLEFRFDAGRAGSMKTYAQADSEHEKDGVYPIEISLYDFLIKKWLKKWDYDSFKEEYWRAIDRKAYIDTIFN